MTFFESLDLERVPVPTSMTAGDVSLLIRALDLCTSDEVVEHERRDRLRSHLFESLMDAQFKYATPEAPAP